MWRHLPLLVVLLLVAGGGAWWLLTPKDPGPSEDYDLGQGLGMGARTAGGAGPRPLDGARPAQAAAVHEIALPGARSLKELRDEHAQLTIKMPHGDDLSGADLLDALTARMRVRFARAEDAAEFRRRSGHAPLDVQDGEMRAAVDILPVLVDAMGFMMGEDDGVLVLERPDHVVHEVEPPGD